MRKISCDRPIHRLRRIVFCLCASAVCLAPRLAFAVSPASSSTGIIVELEDSDGAGFVQPRDRRLQTLFRRYGTPGLSRTFARLSGDFTTHAEGVRKRFPRRAARQPRPGSLHPLDRFYTLTFPDIPPEELDAVIAELATFPFVKQASRDPVLKTNSVPDDPYYASSGSWGQGYDDLWGLKLIGAEDAWDITTGDANVVIAVVDTGLDFTHEDIEDNVYEITAERAGNGRDDDGNGYVDDSRGYDLANDDADPTDDHGHGTHVSGTIAATGDNGRGITGVMWDASILPVKALDENGSGSSSDVAEAIVYAADNGADVINLSLGGSGSDALEAAVEYAHALGVVVVASAGNDAGNASSTYPSGYTGVITVGSTTTGDTLSDFSNFGPKLDLTAPGGNDDDDTDTDKTYRNILSLRAAGTDIYGEAGLEIVDSDYYRARGTSMAAPHVSGTAGLLLSFDPTLTVEEVRQSLRLGADDIADSGWDATSGYGRLNAAGSLDVSARCEALITTPANYDIAREKTLTVSGTAGGSDFGGYTVSLGEGLSASTWKKTSSRRATAVSDGTLWTYPPSLSFTRPWPPLPDKIKMTAITLPFLGASLAEGPYTVKLTVYDSDGDVCGEDVKVFHRSRRTASYSFMEDGGSVNTNLGYALAAGDVNGDGADDLIFGAPACGFSTSCASPTDPGEVFLVLGGTSGLSADTPVTDEALVPVSWEGDDAEERLGMAIAAGDMDGDGSDEVVLGRPGDGYASSRKGAVCVFDGSDSASWSRQMDPDDARWCFTGEANNDRLGAFLEARGDYDGDGLRDLAVAACGNDDAGTDYGKIYILYGADRASWGASNSVQAEAGTEIMGTAATTISCSTVYFGRGLDVAAADMNGDGYDELVVGSPDADSDDGIVAVFEGSATGIASGSLDDADLSVENDVMTNGGFGTRVHGIGDINGDGFDDILAAYNGDQLSGVPAGAYVIEGGTEGATTLATLDPPALTDFATYEYGHSAAEAAGDVNGDGIGDFVTTAFGYDLFDSTGIAYLVHGDTSGLVSAMTMESADAILKEDEEDAGRGFFGYALAAGDFDGDGAREIAVGAPTAGVAVVYVFGLE